MVHTSSISTYRKSYSTRTISSYYLANMNVTVSISSSIYDVTDYCSETAPCRTYATPIALFAPLARSTPLHATSEYSSTPVSGLTQPRCEQLRRRLFQNPTSASSSASPFGSPLSIGQRQDADGCENTSSGCKLTYTVLPRIGGLVGVPHRPSRATRHPATPLVSKTRISRARRHIIQRRFRNFNWNYFQSLGVV